MSAHERGSRALVLVPAGRQLRRRLVRCLTLLGCALTASLSIGLTPSNAAAQSANPPAQGQQGRARFRDGVVLVGFRAGTSDDEAEAVAQQEGAQRIARIGAGTHVLRVPNGAVSARLAALRRHPRVAYAEPDYVLSAAEAPVPPNDPQYGQLWGLKNTGQSVGGTAGTAGADVQAESAWAVTTGTAAVVVGVIDTGIDYNHPDLAANVWSNPGGIGGCAAGTYGYNAITDTCDPMDDNHHGTHVAGTIGASGNNALGVAGVNWTTRLMALKFLDSTGSGYTSDAIKAIDFAVNAKQAGVPVRVLNNSWAGGDFSQALLDAINRAAGNDILFVAAAGNNATNTDVAAYYPAGYATANEIAVAATDQQDALAWFSNYGAQTVHLGAPGTNILSTLPGSSYGYLSGTSMATPHVSGAAALILAASNMTTAQLKAAILASVDPDPALLGKTLTGGRLNVCRALPGCVARVLAAATSTPTPTTTPTQTVAASLTATATPTRTVGPSLTPTATSKPMATASPTATATVLPTATPTPNMGSVTIDFNTLAPANRTLSGQYPTGVVDWGTNAWYLSGPWRAFTTNSVGFNGPGSTSALLTFVAPRRLVQVMAFNGGPASSTITLACPGQSPAQVVLAANQQTTLATNWTVACSPVTIGSTNGWNTNFDNFVIDDAGGTLLPTGTSTATPTDTSTPTAIPTATTAISTPTVTATRTTTPTRTPTPTATGTSTVLPTTTPLAGSQTITFDDLPSPNRPLSGQYPTGVIDWATNRWYLSRPWRAFTTNSVGFNGPGSTSESFTFVTPKRLVQIAAFNGGTISSTITLACAGQPTAQAVLTPNQQTVLATGWTTTCTTVTIGSTNGWNTNFDSLVIDDGLSPAGSALDATGSRR